MLLRIAHITLALLVFVSSTGAPLFRHYCMDRVKDVSLFTKAATCQPVQKTCAKNSDHKNGIQRKKCCQDRVDYLKISSDLTDHVLHHNFNLDIIATLPVLPVAEILATSLQTVQWLNYRPPPPINTAIYIWVQSFLC
ncbi:MAG: HYC_CC_PP family protein [Saprospiraceae bacterium]